MAERLREVAEELPLTGSTSSAGRPTSLTKARHVRKRPGPQPAARRPRSDPKQTGLQQGGSRADSMETGWA